MALGVGTCRHCGKTFHMRSWQHKTCDSCIDEFNRLRARRRMAELQAAKQVEHTLTCRACGSSFVTTNRSRGYCSPECRVQGARDRLRRWHENHPDSRKEHGQRHDTKPEAKVRYRERNLLKLYGLTYEQWQSMLDRAGSRCEICKKSDVRLCVDHCHETGKIRGVLCTPCNRALGQFDDSVELISAAARYLNNHGAGWDPSTSSTEA